MVVNLIIAVCFISSLIGLLIGNENMAILMCLYGWGFVIQDKLKLAEYQDKKIKELKKKYIRPRDERGRFISKKDQMTEQLKREQTSNWDEVKAAAKQEEFGR